MIDNELHSKVERLKAEKLKQIKLLDRQRAWCKEGDAEFERLTTEIRRVRQQLRDGEEAYWRVANQARKMDYRKFWMLHGGG